MRRRTQQERVEESSRRLAEAAVALIAEKGYAATTAQQIGLRAGYSRDMVRVRFGTKEALVDTILTTLYEERFTAVQDAGTSGIERVLSPIQKVHGFAVEDPGLLKAMFVLNFEAAQADDLLRQRVTQWLDSTVAVARAAVETGHADGTIDSSFEPAVLSRELLATMIGYAYLWTVNPRDFDLEATLHAWIVRLRSSLQPRP